MTAVASCVSSVPLALSGGASRDPTAKRPEFQCGRPSLDPALESLLAKFAKTGDQQHLASAFTRLRSFSQDRIGGRLGADDADDILQGAIAKFIVRAPNLPKSYLSWFNNIVDEEVELAIGRRYRDRAIRALARDVSRCAVPRDVESDVFVSEIYAATSRLSRTARKILYAFLHEPQRRPSLAERQALAFVTEMVHRRFEASDGPFRGRRRP